MFENFSALQQSVFSVQFLSVLYVLLQSSLSRHHKKTFQPLHGTKDPRKTPSVALQIYRFRKDTSLLMVMAQGNF